ncbi:MAG: class I SAM-dependent methyltransferase [Deltaproteobacteria bacterium]|nr:class I SAM-dependent methyltransferase [Deltaproteobacteria bacterium]
MQNLSDQIRQDVEYAFSCIAKYMEYFPRENIHGSSVCEIGPGKNMAVCLTFKSLGAAGSYAVDKYLKPWNEEYHPEFYKAMAYAVRSRWPDADMNPFIQCIERNGHAAENVSILAEDAEILAGIPDASLDFLYSWAALEHLYAPPRAFARFAALTKPGGLGMHQVDFRDHHDFSRPLEFLLHLYRWNQEPDEAAYAWLAGRLGRSANQARLEGFDANGLIRRICGYHGNSYRHVDYDALWAGNGFSVEGFEKNMSAGETYLGDFLPRLAHADVPCRRLSKNNLDVVSGLYKLRKV